MANVNRIMHEDEQQALSNGNGASDSSAEAHSDEKIRDENAHDDDPNSGNGEKDSNNPTTSKPAAIKDKISNKKEKLKDKKNPPGGFSDTPIPPASDGFTVRFTFHRAENLPVSDIASRSSDPYITATLKAPTLQKRHKEDPDMILRTRTIHHSKNPEWNQEWIVAGIPSGGFRLKCRLYDEDEADHDDRLGNVTIEVSNIGTSWPGIKEQVYDVRKRMGSKRAYLIRGCAAMLFHDVHMNARLVVSAEVIGKSDPPHGRMYTVGPTGWTKHYSPVIGRIAGTKAPDRNSQDSGKTERYDFQANQMQLEGPVPAPLYHRFVEFKGFVKGMFSKAGVRGRILNSLLHHQHRRVYNYSRSTEYGVFEPKSEEASLKFLEMAHFDEGGRIFTYVLTLDGLFRFTETGKEFGIDLLSKHTMHSDVNIYIACSGEFFIRRLSKPDKPAEAPDQETHPSSDLPGGPPHEPPPKVAKDYELVIDNDSGTYRPKADLLPDLESFLSANFPGLHVVTKDGFDKQLEKMKEAQREMKKKQGKNVVMLQHSDDEISSSDEEDLGDQIGGTRKKSKRAMAFAAVEDPTGTLKSLVPGERSRKKREVREEKDDIAAEGASS